VGQFTKSRVELDQQKVENLIRKSTSFTAK